MIMWLVSGFSANLWTGILMLLSLSLKSWLAHRKYSILGTASTFFFFLTNWNFPVTLLLNQERSWYVAGALLIPKWFSPHGMMESLVRTALSTNRGLSLGQPNHLFLFHPTFSLILTWCSSLQQLCTSSHYLLLTCPRAGSFRRHISS